MTDSNYTAIQLLIDRSGSMYGIRSDAEGGVKTFIEEQRALPGKCTLRFAHFDDRYEIVHESLPIADAPVYVLTPRGSTALLDAWGRTMVDFGAELAALSEDERPDNVVFVVVTDGLENSSTEWTYESVSVKVKEQTEKWGWKFLYLGSGQDAVHEGAKLGVPRSQSLTYGVTGQSVNSSYSAAAAAVTRTRSGKSVTFTADERKSANS